MNNFNEATGLALKTWYPKDHELHLNPHHPLGKLLGEWGELLDDYMKSLYKPGYVFEPEDELGDIWYYIRILCYQYKYTPHKFHMPTDDIGFIITTAIFHTSEASLSYFRGYFVSKFFLDICFTAIDQISNHYNITLEQLTASNWEKLKPGSVRGGEWEKARELYHGKK